MDVRTDCPASPPRPTTAAYKQMPKRGSTWGPSTLGLHVRLKRPLLRGGAGTDFEGNAVAGLRQDQTRVS